jgi:hypothetical protein
MGHKTPTNVFAWTGEQIRELHKAIAITSFFTSHFPHPRLLPNAAWLASSAAIPLALFEGL